MPIKTLSDYPARPNGTPRPLVSVITAVRNGAAGLARTIASITAQDIPDREYIVVDGASADGTLDIIRAHQHGITHWQSEPDGGISDGLNKGIALARGRYIALVHADDWLSPGQLKQGVATLERTGADFVFGDLLYYRGGHLVHRMRGESGYAARIAHVMPALNHPTVILRREAYEKLGLFDTDYRLAMDYELLLRFHRGGLRGVYDPQLVGNMTLAGASDRNSAKALAEVRRASIAHGYPAWKAWTLYGLRLLKDRGRRLTEALLPARWHAGLRRRINRQFTSVS